FGGGADTPPAAEGTSASTAPPATSEAPPGTSSVVPPAVTTTSAPVPPSPTGVAPPPVTPPGAAKVQVRVYNNSTITGLAGRASDEVRANGWAVVDTGNYSQGTIPTTTVYFRPGTE